MVMKMSNDRKTVLVKIKELAKSVRDQIKHGENPKMDMSLRSLSNVELDEKMRLSLGTKVKSRYFVNTAHARKFMQTLLISSVVKNLLEKNIHATLREVYYGIVGTIEGSNINTVNDQRESDNVIVDLEVILNVLREEMHILAKERGKMVGPVSVLDPTQPGDPIRLDKQGRGAWAIPGAIEDLQITDTDSVDFVLFAEKDAAFNRLNEDKFWKKHNCILISSQGQADRSTRRMLHRLSYEYKLPVYILTDADPAGWYIYSVIKRSSISLAHTSERLATPNAKFVGVTITDIERNGLEKITIKAKDWDIKRAQELTRYPWFKHPAWQKEIDKFLKKKYKAEIQIFANKDFKYLSDVYLPEKIENKDFLP